MIRATFFLLAGLGAFAADRWEFLGATTVGRNGACAVALADGRLLLASRGVEIIDGSGAVTPGAELASSHARHACVLLADGRVLLTGGTDGKAVMSQAEIYDPAKNEWTAAGAMTAARMGHTSTLLADGRVLITGGEGAGGALDSMEAFDPATGRFVPMGTMTARRSNHAVAMLPDGRVLIAGGMNEGGALASVEIYQPATLMTAREAPMTAARSGLTATVMADGTVLLAGGTNGFAALASAEIYNPATGAATETAAMSRARSGQLAFALPDGGVLLAGGDGTAATAEVFVKPMAAAGRSADARATAVMAAANGTVVRTAPGRGSGTLDQCANGPSTTPGVIGLTCVSWVNGNLNSSKASYREGDSVPYRLRMSGVPTTGSNTVIIEWDTTASGQHALDYITRFNAAVTGADPCMDGACSGAPTMPLYPIPLDPAITEGTNQPSQMMPGRLAFYTAQNGTQHFAMWGGTITSVSSIRTVGSYIGSAMTEVTITFTASIPNPVLAWGGHIATRMDWGAAYSAVAINGSPFHTRLQALNGAGGNQDRALSNDAAVFPATISITKAVNTSANAGDFTFGASPAVPDGTTPVSAFSLPYLVDTTLNYTRVFNQIYIPTGTQTYAFSETGMPLNWTLQSVACQKVAGSGSFSVANNVATINAQEGDTFACTFTNAAPVQVTLTKACVPTGDLGTFTLNIGGTASQNPVSCGGSFSKNVAVGASVTVSETGTTLGNYSSAINCGTAGSASGTSHTFTMPASNVSCTVTNTRKSYDVTFAKVCAPTTDLGKFVLNVNGSGGEVGCGASVTKQAVGGTTVTLTETAGTNTDLANYLSEISCTGISLGGTGLTRTFTMPDQAVSCTVTNRRPSVSISKTCKAGLSAALAVAVASTGQICNTGGVTLTNLVLTDVQTGATNNATGSVTFSTADLLPGDCRTFTSVFSPTEASSGSCATGDATCTVAFTDKATISAKAGAIDVSNFQNATCSLCK